MIRYIPALVYSNKAASGAFETVRGYGPPGPGANWVVPRRKVEGAGKVTLATGPSEKSPANLMSHGARPARPALANTPRLASL